MVMVKEKHGCMKWQIKLYRNEKANTDTTSQLTNGKGRSYKKSQATFIQIRSMKR